MLERVIGAAALASALAATLTAGLGAQQSFVLATDPPPKVPMPAILKQYAAVTTERLTQPDPADWLMLRGRRNEAVHSAAEDFPDAIP